MSRLERAANRAGWLVLAFAIWYVGAHVVAAVLGADPGTVAAWAVGLFIGAVLVAGAVLSTLQR